MIIAVFESSCASEDVASAIWSIAAELTLTKHRSVSRSRILAQVQLGNTQDPILHGRVYGHNIGLVYKFQRRSVGYSELFILPFKLNSGRINDACSTES